MQHVLGFGVEPVESFLGLQFAAQSDRAPIEREHGGRDVVLSLDGLGCVPVGLRQMRQRVPEPREVPAVLQGSGTRQPSRPISTLGLRKKEGSWWASSGICPTSRSPSYSPGRDSWSLSGRAAAESRPRHGAGHSRCRSGRGRRQRAARLRRSARRCRGGRYPGGPVVLPGGVQDGGVVGQHPVGRGAGGGSFGEVVGDE